MELYNYIILDRMNTLLHQGIVELVALFLVSTPIPENVLFVLYQSLSIVLLEMADRGILKCNDHHHPKETSFVPKFVVLLSCIFWYLSPEFQIIQHLVTLQV